MITSSPQGAPSGPTYRTPPSSAPSRRQQQERPGIGEAAGDLVVDVATDAAGKYVQDQITKVVFEQAAEGATEEVAAEAAVAAAEESGLSISDVTTAIAWARQAYKAYQILSSDMTDEEKAQALAKAAGLAVADYFTFGLASLAYGTLGQSKEWQRIEKELLPFDPISQAAGSFGSLWGGSKDAGDVANVLTLGTSGVLGSVADQAFGINHPLHRKTTKDYQRGRLRAAFENAASDSEKQFIARLIGNLDSSSDIHEGGILEGRKWSWEDLQGLGTPESVWGEYAFFEAFPDWLTGYTEEQRRQIAQAALDEQLLESDKGSVLASRKKGNFERLQEIGRQVKEGAYTSPVSPEERELKRREYAESVGINYDEGMAREQAWGEEQARRHQEEQAEIRAKMEAQINTPAPIKAPRITSSPQGELQWRPPAATASAPVDYESRAQMEAAFARPQPQQVNLQPQGPRITSAPQGPWAGASMQGGV